MQLENDIFKNNPSFPSLLFHYFLETHKALKKHYLYMYGKVKKNYLYI